MKKASERRTDKGEGKRNQGSPDVIDTTRNVPRDTRRDSQSTCSRCSASVKTLKKILRGREEELTENGSDAGGTREDGVDTTPLYSRILRWESTC